MRGWTISNWTERRCGQAYDRLSLSRPAVERRGRSVTAEPIADGSFFVRPHDLPVVMEIDEGVPAALRSHLAAQGLLQLADSVVALEKIAARLREQPPRDRSVSETVYQMY